MQCVIEVRTPYIDVVKKAMETEIESSPYERTTTTLDVINDQVVITITTDDIRALRGTFNSYMNWLKTIVESLSV
ncbi:MAG: KEOPS complex subunit Pcc1 [Candidatus Methanofastidiosia archaeon]|jgi:tRNA threonylcarbamoyladenosine modification (KEOPS) complex  Pcc1 subunit